MGLTCLGRKEVIVGIALSLITLNLLPYSPDHAHSYILHNKTDVVEQYSVPALLVGHIDKGEDLEKSHCEVESDLLVMDIVLKLVLVIK